MDSLANNTTVNSKLLLMRIRRNTSEAGLYRSAPLETKEVMALYGEETDDSFVRNEDCISEEEEDVVSEDSSEEEKGGRRRRVVRSLSLEIYGLQRDTNVHFSNQEYCRRLQELKSAHLRNMNELERMYVSHGREWRPEDDGGREENREARLSISSSGPTRKLQRINSQEELDFHDTSSGSDQSELCGEDSVGEQELYNPRGQCSHDDRTFGRQIQQSPEKRTTQQQFWFQPKTSSCVKPHHTRLMPSPKVTVPKPFNMMVREEERKRHKVRTRSEIELENTLLRRELEELQECQKKFRAAPAPAHIHRPLYEMISQRSCQQRSIRNINNNNNNNNSNRNTEDNKRTSNNGDPPAQPFHFLEREKRKREAKIVAELRNQGPKNQRQPFKARPMPSSVYGARRRAKSDIAKCHRPQFVPINPPEREATEGQSESSSDLEPEAFLSDSSPESVSRKPRNRCPSSSSKPVKKQIELSIEMVREAVACNISNICSLPQPLQPSSSEPLLCYKSDYVKV